MIVFIFPHTKGLQKRCNILLYTKLSFCLEGSRLLGKSPNMRCYTNLVSCDGFSSKIVVLNDLLLTRNCSELLCPWSRTSSARSQTQKAQNAQRTTRAVYTGKVTENRMVKCDTKKFWKRGTFCSLGYSFPGIPSLSHKMDKMIRVKWLSQIKMIHVYLCMN